MIKTKAFVFDFDDTLAFTDAKVHVLSPSKLIRKALTLQAFTHHNLGARETIDCCG